MHPLRWYNLTLWWPVSLPSFPLLYPSLSSIPLYSVHSTNSIATASARTVIRILSIFQYEYSDAVARAAFLCHCPLLPWTASSRVRQMHVAKFLPSASGVPNQYLSPSN